MDSTTKEPSQLASQNVLRAAFNDVDATLTVNGFLVGKVGRKVEQAISTTTVTDDTETFTFSENGTVLYSIRVIYTTGARSVMLSAERIA